MIEHIAAVLIRGVLALRGVHDAPARNTAQFATLDYRFAVAENEIGIAFNETVGEVLASRGACVVAIAIAARREQSILGTGQAETSKDRPIASDMQRDPLSLSRAKIVDDAEMGRAQIQRLLDACGVRFLSRRLKNRAGADRRMKRRGG